MVAIKNRGWCHDIEIGWDEMHLLDVEDTPSYDTRGPRDFEPELCHNAETNADCDCPECYWGRKGHT
jgi:hypothetical protein